jgi:FdhD protein
MADPSAVATFPVLRFHSGDYSESTRELPEETPVALVHDGSTTAVMMASPQDLEDLAFGFAFTEGVITSRDQVRSVEIAASSHGLEARMWLSADRSAHLSERRRAMVGPIGCGLCGVESLEQADRDLPTAPPGPQLTPVQIQQSVEATSGMQPLGRMTRATHAAALWIPDTGLVAAREDVGRHNALDKLAGALIRQGLDARAGVIVLTSRVSIEMVQKAAMIGGSVIVAVSAPTALAVRAAGKCGLTLIGIARPDGFEVFSGRQRVADV